MMKGARGLMTDEPERIAIPLVEESLRVRRRAVETGRVRVSTVPEERTEMVSEMLQHSEAHLDRSFVNCEIDEVPPVREEGNTVIVPVVEERLVKRLFLVEEIRITRQVIAERFEAPVTLRSQRAVIEDDTTDKH